ncbi:MAG: hypothetical protein Q7T49_00185 [bacterium]|nr:hypothetical protein [bacterium]
MKEKRTEREEANFQSSRRIKSDELERQRKKGDYFPGLNLQIGVEGKAEARALVTWCVPPQTAKALADHKLDHVGDGFCPYVLISVLHEGGQETERLIVPFHKMATYLTFRRPGSHFILGVLFWSYDPIWELRTGWCEKYGNGVYCKALFLRETAAEYELPLEECLQLGYLGSNIGISSVKVDVDPQFFAKEWPQWVKNFVESWYDQPSRDQCQFRRRLIFSALFKSWLLIVGWLVVSSLRLGWALYGLLLAVKPSQIAWSQILSLKIGDNFLERVWLKKNVNYWSRRVVFRPLTWIFLGVIGYYFYSRYGMEVKVQPNLVIGLLIVASVVAVLVPLTALLLGRLMKDDDNHPPVKTERQKKKEARHKSLRQKKFRWEEQLRVEKETAIRKEFEAMTCRLGAKPVLAELPPEKVTIFLKAEAWKNKVCKPFAR